MDRRFTPRPLQRKDVYPQAVVDGRPAKTGQGRVGKRLTVVVNKMPSHSDPELVCAAFDEAGVSRQVVVPHDDQLATMLDSSSYTLEGLGRPTRMAIREVGLVVAQRLV